MEAGETFTDFLDAAALVSDADHLKASQAWTLITLHSTKGLEFDHVFLTEWKKAICPPARHTEEKESRKSVASSTSG